MTDNAAWTAQSRELAELLARTGLGDRQAFSALYGKTSGYLFGVVLRIQRERALAEDLLQDIYVSVWKNAAGFDAARSQPLTWLTHVARHRAIDSLRRAAAQPQTMSLDADEDGDGGEGREPGAAALAGRIADEGPGPAELLERSSQAREIGECMQRLSAAQRQSVALAFFDGLSHAEVAEQLRQPLGTVKSWVRRALATLKSCLDRAALRDAAASAAPSAAVPAAAAAGAAAATRGS
jgi:RNA polymerase sigma-70 factor (ECF subfamily)